MKNVIKLLSSPWLHVFIGLIFWIVPFLLFYFSGRVLDVYSLVVGALASAGISCFDFGLHKLMFKN